MKILKHGAMSDGVHRYLTFKPRVLKSVNYHVPCPECRSKVELKVVTKNAE